MLTCPERILSESGKALPIQPKRKKKSSAEALPGGKRAVCPNPVFFLP